MQCRKDTMSHLPLMKTCQQTFVRLCDKIHCVSGLGSNSYLLVCDEPGEGSVYKGIPVKSLPNCRRRMQNKAVWASKHVKMDARGPNARE